MVLVVAVEDHDQVGDQDQDRDLEAGLHCYVNNS